MKKQSATHYILKALIPYTEANLNLVFKPSAFFTDLEKISRANQHTFQTAYGRAIKQGLVELDFNNIPRLTNKGQRALAPFESSHLDGAKLMVIFDIPEAEKWKRQQLRSILREFRFKQIQKSVWSTDLDCQQYIAEAVKDLGLTSCVLLFEAKEISINSH